VHVVLTDAAITDLDEIWDFVSESSPESADKLLHELIDFGLSLGQFPSRYAVVPGDMRADVRRANFRSWALFFRVFSTHVEVLRIVHCGRNLDSLRL